ncbi:tetratricopeptide repeat protein [Clostridium sp.]|uniref:tetratricopeptide repeat protein n=1 Tax=Clostridium sp. TaxID=1506 RepID=UPI00261F6AFF|nr:tetratricopeptide repeat protein [Clostridium sp.]
MEKHFEKANELYNNENYAEALKWYNKAIEFDAKGNTASLLYNSGVCCMKLNRHNKAIPYFQQALRICKDSKYYYNIGYSYYCIGETSKALLNFNTAWALNNEDDECKKAINLILREKFKTK